MFKKQKSYGDSYSAYLNAKSLFETGEYNFIDAGIKTITFQVTEACNLNCTYCYQINKSPNKMTFDIAKKFIDLLLEDSYKEDSYVYIGNTHGIILDFIGGEPLLEIDLIDRITDYFRYETIRRNHPWATTYLAGFISNGVLYFDDKVQEYLKKNRYKVDFSISVDGCKELHDSCRVFYDGSGSYDLAEAACKHYMKNFNPEMSTKMTIAPENITWTLKAFKNLHELGYKNIFANCIYEEGWKIEDSIEYYKQLKSVADYLLDNDLEDNIFTSIFQENAFHPMEEYDNKNYCGTTGHMLALDYKGDIFTCLRFMKSSLGEDVEPFSIGNIYDGIGRNPNHANRINILSSITRRSQSTDECFNCPVAAGCGNCTALNYQVHGNPDKKSLFACDMHKARGLANVYYWNKVYKKRRLNHVFKNYLPKDDCLRIINIDEYEMLEELSK